jgi:hypothetical protein
MRRNRTNLLGLGLLLLAACDDSSLTGSAHGELQAAESDSGEAAGRPSQGEGDQGVRQLADAGAPAVNLMCPRGGNTGPVSVLFACDRITVITCKDLSNVVLELANGTRQRLQGLNGRQNVFVSTSGQTIVGVWVKAGPNSSGDGPGYGERFDAPSAGCADAGTPPPPNPPTPPTPPPSDTDACVPGPDMPCFYPPAQPPSPPPQDPPPAGWVD